MRKSLIALLLSVPVLALAADGKVVSDQIRIDASQKVRVAMDKGYLTVLPSADGALDYSVEFKPDETCSLFPWGKIHPSEDDYRASSVSFDHDKGVLTIQTGKHLDAVVKLKVPVKQSLDVQLKTVAAKIGPLAGRLDAFIENGIVKYDASALAQAVCVDASINDGIVHNKRDFQCSAPGAALHGHSGIISVY